MRTQFYQYQLSNDQNKYILLSWSASNLLNETLQTINGTLNALRISTFRQVIVLQSSFVCRDTIKTEMETKMISFQIYALMNDSEHHALT